MGLRAKRAVQFAKFRARQLRRSLVERFQRIAQQMDVVREDYHRVTQAARAFPASAGV